jgi:hypothetical protein
LKLEYRHSETVWDDEQVIEKAKSVIRLKKLVTFTAVFLAKFLESGIAAQGARIGSSLRSADYAKF